MFRCKAAWLLPLVALAACSGNEAEDAKPDAAMDAAPPPTVTPGAIEVACNDSLADTFAAPAKLEGTPGTILKCAKDVAIAKADLIADGEALGQTGLKLTSGARAYRVLYVTERGTNSPKPAFASAVIYLPDEPAAAKLPSVVVAHGTAGQGGPCAPSQDANGSAKSKTMYMTRPIVGRGFPVIVPDYAGYAGYGAAGNPPSGYFAAADEARSVLDAARALRNAIPTRTSNQVVLVGHSQGGHAVLSGLALAGAYASELKLAGVAAYAPSWQSGFAWGALLAVPDMFPMKTQPLMNAAVVYFHYSLGELLDGPGKGAELFVESKRATIKSWFDTKCDPVVKLVDGALVFTYDPSFTGLGETPADYFDPTFVSTIGTIGMTGDGCTNSDAAAKALCEKWRARYAAVRPHLTGAATSVPILWLHGNKDTSVTPGAAMCGLQRLAADKANVTVCIGNSGHIGVANERAGFVSDWIAARTLGAPEPAKCEGDETTLKDPSTGAPATCAAIPPNDKD